MGNATSSDCISNCSNCRSHCIATTAILYRDCPFSTSLAGVFLSSIRIKALFSFFLENTKEQ